MKIKQTTNKINFLGTDVDFSPYDVFAGSVGQLALYLPGPYQTEKPIALCSTLTDFNCVFSKRGRISLECTDAFFHPEILDAYQKNTIFSSIIALPLYKEQGEKAGSIVITLERAKIDSIGDFNSATSSVMLFTFQIKPLWYAKKSESKVEILDDRYEYDRSKYQGYLNLIDRLRDYKGIKK